MSAAVQILSERPITWRGAPLRGPVSGQILREDGPNRLVAPGEAWPVIDGIPYLRSGRDSLVRACLDALDAGALDRATAMLLVDTAEPSPQTLDLVARRDTLCFREAMRLLGYGALCDELAHRWTDPSFLSALALTEAYWPERGPAAGTVRPRLLEIGCGPGHFLRAVLRATPEVTGIDSQFSHLWLARHFVAPGANLACTDLAGLACAYADLVLCHAPALPATEPANLATELRRVAAPGATWLLHHVVPGAMPLADACGPCALLDETELVSALVQRRAPRARPASGLAAPPVAGASAIALAAGAASTRRPAPVLGLLDAPARGAALRRNPLYCEQDDGTCVRRFPSARYAEAYAGRVTYPAHVTARARVIAGADPADDALIRRRVWVDLPARW